MDQQLLEALREVMHSELMKGLAPVHTKLDRLDGQVGSLEGAVDKLGVRVGNLEGKVISLEGKFSSLEGKVSNLEFNMETVIKQLSSMQNQLDRIEHTQNEDVVAILHQVNQKTADRFERTDSQMRVLNDRLFTAEADIRKLQQS